MKHIQNYPDYRKIDLQRVGIKDLHLPLKILEKKGSTQSVLANISLSVDLPRHFKGTHLSRYVEVLTKWSKRRISSVQLKDILQETRKALCARQAQITLKFKYFIKKKTPATRRTCFLDYGCEFIGILDKNGFNFILGVEVPIMALCPCSKEISKYGAHNQRGVIRTRVRYKGKILWIEDLVALLEKQGSSQIYPLLKRADEKFVTELSYKNPKFVEDILRDIIIQLRKNKNILWLETECEDFESVHNHSAFAYHKEPEVVIST